MFKFTLALVCLALMLSGFNSQTAPATTPPPTSTPPPATTTPTPAPAPTPTPAPTPAPAPTTTPAPAPAPTPAPTPAPAPAASTAPTTTAAAPPPVTTTTPPPPSTFPPTNLTFYVIEPYFYSTDVTTQIIAHLFCQADNPSGITQCALYDSSDPATARLLGVEYILNETQFTSLTPSEQRFWHSHGYGVQSGNIIAPYLTGANYTSTMATIAGTYGKAVLFWSEIQPSPLGDPILLFAFSDPGQFNATASATYDATTNTTAGQRAANNANITIPTPAAGANGWDIDGIIPIFDDVNATLPNGLWGLVFPRAQ